MSESKAITDFGGSVMIYPMQADSVNDICLHPRILSAVEQLLGTSDIRLTQAEVWPKYGNDRAKDGVVDVLDNSDQRIHCDYPNHTLVHPPEVSRIHHT